MWRFLLGVFVRHIAYCVLWVFIFSFLKLIVPNTIVIMEAIIFPIIFKFCWYFSKPPDSFIKNPIERKQIAKLIHRRILPMFVFRNVKTQERVIIIANTEDYKIAK